MKEVIEESTNDTLMFGKSRLVATDIRYSVNLFLNSGISSGIDSN